MEPTSPNEHFDVPIVGAGLSGIGRHPGAFLSRATGAVTASVATPRCYHDDVVELSIFSLIER
jgi:hypothetical protein